MTKRLIMIAMTGTLLQGCSIREKTTGSIDQEYRAHVACLSILQEPIRGEWKDRREIENARFEDCKKEKLGENISRPSI